MPSKRMLVIHPSDYVPLQVEDLLEKVTALLARAIPGVSFDLVPVGTWRSETYAAAGSVDSWLWDTVNGNDYHTREPHFAGYFVLSPVSETYCRMILLALQQDKAVLSTDGARLTQVRTPPVQLSEGLWAAEGTPIQGLPA